MEPLRGLILAGGRSARMGQDKAGLDYHGVSQTHYLAQLLSPLVAEVHVSLRREQKDASYMQGLNTICDHYRTPSPLNGIVSAMRSLPGYSLLVVAVDMPNITTHAAKILIAHRDPASIATCFESPFKGGPDPLFAIWETHAYTDLEARIIDEKTHVCPRAVLKSGPAHILKKMIAPHVLDNINTPEDLAKLKRAS